MGNSISEYDHWTVKQGQEKNLNKWRSIIGFCLAIGLLWLFWPKMGDPDYDPIDIASHQGKIISDYRDGNITIAGKKYNDRGVIIFPDRVKYGWGGMEDHALYPDEIEDVVNEDIDTVVIGNGYQGNAFVMKETKKLLKSKEIKIHLLNTHDAVDLYNKLPKRKLVGIFHLNC
jgi:hypothetical protein